MPDNLGKRVKAIKTQLQQPATKFFVGAAIVSTALVFGGYLTWLSSQQTEILKTFFKTEISDQLKENDKRHLKRIRRERDLY